MFRSENNNLDGTIPFENCENFAVLSSDCSAPRDVTCPCCTSCFGIFTTYEDVLGCPSSILNLKYDSLVKVYDKITYRVMNDVPQLIATNSGYERFAGDEFKSCVSPTDCFTLKSMSDAYFNVSVDGNLLFEDLKGFGTHVKFGYSRNGTVKPKNCEMYTICNRDLHPKTQHRNLFNLITRFSGSGVFYDQSSYQHRARCWWLNDLDKNLGKKAKMKN